LWSAIKSGINIVRMLESHALHYIYDTYN